MIWLEWCIVKYIVEGDMDDIIDGIIFMVCYLKEYYLKMVQVLELILEMLGFDEIGDLLLLDLMDIEDIWLIYDMCKVIDEKVVFYIGLDSLFNKIIVSVIGFILFVDLLLMFGVIYNFSQLVDCYFFVDEVVEVVNDQLIQILNKGGGVGIKCFLVMQVIVDLMV